MADSSDINRGLGTYIETESPLLGAADAFFGSDASADGLNRDTSSIKEGFGSTANESTTNALSNQLASSNALTGSTGFSQGSTQNTGLQESTGLNVGSQVGTGTTNATSGVGAFSGNTGIGTSGYDPTTGQFNANLSQPYQGNVNNALTASNQAYGALSGMDFNTTMGQRYNALEALQEQDRIQAQLDMEDRLYSQGRLGSSGGALQQNALMDAIAQQQAGNSNQAYNQALSYQQQQGNMASQFGQNALAPQQLNLQQLQAMGALAPQVSSSTNTNAVNTTDSTSNQVGSNSLSNTTGINESTGFNDQTSALTNQSSTNTLDQGLEYSALTGRESIRERDENSPTAFGGTYTAPTNELTIQDAINSDPYMSIEQYNSMSPAQQIEYQQLNQQATVV